jgi:class 3 adenylate cyclase
MELSPQNQEKIEISLLEGVCSRSALLCLIFAVGFTLYGYSSLEFFQLFKPDLTLGQNTWPRFLLNGIPFGLLSAYLWRNKKNAKAKAWGATIAIPLLFIVACGIHAWPLMWAGQTGLFLYVHGANVFVISMVVIVISPPKKLLLSIYGIFFCFFLLPVAFMLFKAGNTVLLKTFVNDMILFNGASGLAALSIHNLRREVAILDAQIKLNVKPFLGAEVTKAIYENRPDLLATREVSGLVLFADIRGFTTFKRKYSAEITSEFMKEYHSYFAKVVANHMGHIHKTNGDGHMASFGIMNSEDDISEIAEFNRTELEESETTRKRDYLKQALKAFTLVAEYLESLRQKFGIDDDMRLGAGLTYGKVTIILRGDRDTRQEQDLDGESVIRCSRLESHTKLLQRENSKRTSFAVISPEFEDVRSEFESDLVWQTTQGNKQVRDFPEIQRVMVYSVELPSVLVSRNVS